MSKVNVQGYLDTIKAPWGQLFYQLAWHNIECEGKKILDFGSGFGISANHFAEKNEVIAVEPNEEMLVHRACEYSYEQLVGSVDQLRKLPTGSFDIILCHNVLEYVNNRQEILAEFVRLLKTEGFVSIIKHNKVGKIMQKAVFEYKIDEAMKLLANENVASVNFGTIDEYEKEELEKYSEGRFAIDKVFGLRMFYALQRNELKTGEDWFDNMFRLECMAEEISEFREIAFFHHVILRLK